MSTPCFQSPSNNFRLLKSHFLDAPGHHHQLRPVTTQLTRTGRRWGHPPGPVVQPGFVPQQVLCHLAKRSFLTLTKPSWPWGLKWLNPKKKGTWVDWVDSKDRKDQRLTWSLNTGDGGVIYSQHLQYLDSNKSSPKGDGELFFEPKNWVIQVKLVISNGETDGRTRALKRLCIYPICSSPSYLAILLYYDSMIFYVFEVKYFCLLCFCFLFFGIWYILFYAILLIYWLYLSSIQVIWFT